MCAVRSSVKGTEVSLATLGERADMALLKKVRSSSTATSFDDCLSVLLALLTTKGVVVCAIPGAPKLTGRSHAVGRAFRRATRLQIRSCRLVQ